MSKDPKQPNILFVARDDGGCGFYRCEQPAAFLTRAGLANAKSVLKHPREQDLLAADLVVLQEMGNVEAMNIVSFLEKHNIPFLVEFDDYIHHISPHNDGGYIAWNPATLYVYRSMEMMKRAWGVTVATEQLAREYFPYNNFIYVVPNYLDKQVWEVPTMKRPDGKIRIGWAGGNAHADDLRMVSKVIERLTKEYDGKVVFETIGMTRRELTGVFSIPPTPGDACAHCGHEGHLHHFPGEAYQNYPQVVGSRGWDIAIAPVIDNGFGNAKSDLKVKEYAALGLPIVASNVRPYRDAKKDGASVMLADSYEDWYSQLKGLIETDVAREKLGKQNKEWSQQNWIQDRIPGIFQVYQEVLARAEHARAQATSLPSQKGV